MAAGGEGPVVRGLLVTEVAEQDELSWSAPPCARPGASCQSAPARSAIAAAGEHARVGAGEAATAELRLCGRGGGALLQATRSDTQEPLFVCQLTPETVRRRTRAARRPRVARLRLAPTRAGSALARARQVWRASETLFFVRAPAAGGGRARTYGVRCRAPGAAGAMADAVHRALERQREAVGPAPPAPPPPAPRRAGRAHA